MASEYDARRFAGPGGRRKQARDEALLRRLLADLPAGARVLDLPAGTGRLRGVLAERGRWVVGADRSREMLRSGAALATPDRVVQADVRALPFPDDAFDVVVSYRFLFHLQAAEERVAALRELARVARSSVVVQVLDASSLKHIGRSLRARLGAARSRRAMPPRATLATELEAAGLRLERRVAVAPLFSDKALLVARPR